VYACLALARLFVNPCYPASRIVEILGAETAWICYKAKLASEIVFVRNRDSCFDLGCAGKSSGHVVFVFQSCAAVHCALNQFAIVSVAEHCCLVLRRANFEKQMPVVVDVLGLLAPRI